MTKYITKSHDGNVMMTWGCVCRWWRGPSRSHQASWCNRFLPIKDGEYLLADHIHWQPQGLASTTAHYLGRSELVPLFLSQPSCSCASPPRWTCRSTPAKSSTCSRAWSCTHWSPGTTPWQPSEAWAAACLECPTFFVWSFLFFCQECPPDPSVSRLQLRLTLWARLVIRFVVEVFRGFYLV